MNQLQEYLKIYFRIEDQQLDAVSHLFEVKTLRKGDFLLEQNKRCNEMAFVKEGLVRIWALAEGKEITQWIMTDGYFVTDINGFVLGGNSRWNVQSLMPTTLYTITKSNYVKIGELVENWHQLEKEFLVHCFVNMENRIFQFLSMNAEERYNSFFRQNKDLFNQTSLQYIASMLGMTPETLSRIRAKSSS